MNTVRLPPTLCPREYSRFFFLDVEAFVGSFQRRVGRAGGNRLEHARLAVRAGRRESRVFRRTGIGIALSASG